MIESEDKKIYECIGCGEHCVIAIYRSDGKFPPLHQIRCQRGNTCWLRVPEMKLEIE